MKNRINRNSEARSLENNVRHTNSKFQDYSLHIELNIIVKIRGVTSLSILELQIHHQIETYKLS